MSEETKMYRFVGFHAEDLASGRLLEPGEDQIELSHDDLEIPHNKRLLDEGLLIVSAEQPAQTSGRRRSANEEGGS